MIAPIFAQLAQRHPNVLFIKVDVDEAQVRPLPSPASLSQDPCIRFSELI